jgi:hypothetical protein
MGDGYVRQSTADIVAGNTVEAGPINAEFNQLQAAFHLSSGHTHDGTTGEGPKISLSTSISGLLAAANGGTGGIHKLNGTTAPTTTDDSDSNYAVGSLWIDTTNDRAYICVDSTSTAAVWVYVGNTTGWQPLDATLTALAGVTTAANKLIYATGSDTFATTTLLDDADATTARSTLGLIIGTNVQAWDADLDALAAISGVQGDVIYHNGTAWVRLGAGTSGHFLKTNGAAANPEWASATTTDAELLALAGLTSAADKLPYFTGSGTAALADFTSFARTLLDDADAATARTTLGLGTANTPQFTGIEVGHASDTTLTRSSAGIIAIEGVTVPLNSITSIHTAQQIEIGHASDTTLARSSAGNLSIEGNVIYRAGGTDVTLADGGTGASLVDPNADRILFWDDSESSMAFLTPGNGLEISTTNLRVLECWEFAISDETTAITTGTAKLTVRAPYAFTVTDVRASLSTASSSGNPTFDINEAGTSILGVNKLSIDANEKTSTTAATGTSIADSSIADDAELTFDIDTAGTGAKGAKIKIYGYRT